MCVCVCEREREREWGGGEGGIFVQYLTDLLIPWLVVITFTYPLFLRLRICTDLLFAAWVFGMDVCF